MASALLAVVFFACKKETDQVLSPDQLAKGTYIRLDSTISNEFNFAQIATSSVAWNVSGKGDELEKIVSYASTNNTTTRSTWRKIKETPVAENKAQIRITGSELATALGLAPTALSPGNQYTIYNEVVTKSGKTFSIINTNAELESAAAYNMALRTAATITCPFNPTGFVGNFQVIADAWEDYNPGDVLQVTAATANSITLVAYPAPAYGTNRQPITININPANGRASIASQYMGDYSGGIRSSISSSTARASYVFSCTGDIILYNNIVYGPTTYGSQLLRLKKI